MAPLSVTTTLQETQSVEKQQPIETITPCSTGNKLYIGYFKTKVIWSNVFGIGLIHFLLLYGIFTFPFLEKKMLILYCCVVGGIGGFGVTAGAHRLWCHRSYKAKLPLRILLMLCYVSAGQNTIYQWVRDHRVHHKFSETDADPHNSNRGFFFSHVGWLMMKKHPEVYVKGKRVDMSDVLSDPVVQFQEKYFSILKLVFCFIIPPVVCHYLLGESWYWSFMTVDIGRYLFLLNFTWCVNSAAHIFGTRPYDKTINPRENKLVAVLAMGEGWHNYHHTFPWDYRTSEIGKINVSAFWINVFSKIGWAYDLKTPSPELVEKVIIKNGDGTYDWAKREVPESEDCETTEKKDF